MLLRASVTHGRLLELLRYDPETGVFTWVKKHTRKVVVGAVAGTINAAGYLQISIDGVTYLGHRLAWLYVKGEFPAGRLDHENLQRSDNRFTNLRPCSHSQNIANSGARANNTSGFKGVSRNGRNWAAEITKDGQKHYLGSFSTPEAAHAAYAKAASSLFGAFARAA